VTAALRRDFRLIQVGSKSDPPIDGALDLRGKTSYREAAALLANSVLFLGLVGFLMHLARAVDCRAVIIYGGRERPWQSGYGCNVNLTGDTSCSPCWRWNTCEYDRECMKLVTVDAVLEGVRSQALKFGELVESDRVEIKP
jgi:ADP-heptose:LPS heptosyltransferase